MIQSHLFYHFYLKVYIPLKTHTGRCSSHNRSRYTFVQFDISNTFFKIPIVPTSYCSLRASLNKKYPSFLPIVLVVVVGGVFFRFFWWKRFIYCCLVGLFLLFVVVCWFLAGFFAGLLGVFWLLFIGSFGVGFFLFGLFWLFFYFVGVVLQNESEMLPARQT